jgi:hypothetical protein
MELGLQARQSVGVGSAGYIRRWFPPLRKKARRDGAPSFAVVFKVFAVVVLESRPDNLYYGVAFFIVDIVLGGVAFHIGPVADGHSRADQVFAVLAQ